jgi:hypothetical protein
MNPLNFLRYIPRRVITVEGLSDPEWIHIRDPGYGYYEPGQIDFAYEPGWLYLVMHFPKLAGLDFARFTCMLDEYAKEVGELLSTVLHPDNRRHIHSRFRLTSPRSRNRFWLSPCSPG